MSVPRGATSRAPARSAPDATGSAGPAATWPGGITTALLVALIAAGVVLRFVTTSPLWLDEALSVNISRLPLADIPEALRHDGHPPLYYVLLHGWIEVFGTGDLAVRALAGVLSVATLPLAWVLGRRVGGRPLAWVLVVVLALSPYALLYATSARMYALLALLVFAGWLLVDDALRAPAPWRLGALGVLSGVLLLTHYWSFWLLGAVLLLLGWVAWRGAEDRRGPARRVALAVCAGGILFLPWLPSFLDQARHTGTPWGGLQRPMAIVATTLTEFGGGDYQEGVLFGAVILVLLVIGLLGRGVDERRVELDVATRSDMRIPALLAGLTLTLGTLAAYATQSTYAARYASVLFPFVLLVVAAGVSRFVGPVARNVVLGVVVVFSVIGAGYNALVPRSQAEDIGEAVRARATPDDLVVICPDQLGPSTSRELPDDLRRVVYPTLGPPDRVDWVDYAERNERADPQEVGRELLAEADESAAIWLVASGDYRTLEGQCEELHSVLAVDRPSEPVIAENPDDFFEHASLHRLAPAG